MVRPIFVSRKVLNSEDIIQWMREQGFHSYIGDMHVTIALDKIGCDWRSLPTDETDILVDYEHRSVELFGDGAIVLEIHSTDLITRWSELLLCGLHWAWEEYRPHITLSYDSETCIQGIIPYSGEILLGPEEWEEAVEIINKDETVIDK